MKKMEKVDFLVNMKLPSLNIHTLLLLRTYAYLNLKEKEPAAGEEHFSYFYQFKVVTHELPEKLKVAYSKDALTISFEALATCDKDLK